MSGLKTGSAAPAMRARSISRLPLLIAIRFSNAAAEENYFPLGGDDSARLLGSAGTGHKGAGFLRLEQAAEIHEGYRHALRLLGVAEWLPPERMPPETSPR